MSANNNQTAQSATLCSLPGTPNYAPYPDGGEIGDAATFIDLPYHWGEYHIMRATTAVDPEDDGVQYFFESDDCVTSGWQTSSSYEYVVGVSPINCSYRVKYKDDLGNESSFSAWVPVTE